MNKKKWWKSINFFLRKAHFLNFPRRQKHLSETEGKSETGGKFIIPSEGMDAPAKWWQCPALPCVIALRIATSHYSGLDHIIFHRKTPYHLTALSCGPFWWPTFQKCRPTHLWSLSFLSVTGLRSSLCSSFLNRRYISFQNEWMNLHYTAMHSASQETAMHSTASTHFTSYCIILQSIRLHCIILHYITP